jgi:pimeloyl-ACP methyl ester carboxylesterase
LLRYLRIADKLPKSFNGKDQRFGGRPRMSHMTRNTAAGSEQNWREIFYTSQDGLTLYARRYGDTESLYPPVVCLPGLTRNSRDFHSLATALSSDPVRPRTVYCLDYRGRGMSDFDENWQNYSPYIELLDILDFMTMEGITGASLIGTSRGGILTMLMAVMRPSAIGAAVLNDIGPVIETAGLARIMGYAGKIPVPATWDAAAKLARDMNKRFFPHIDEREWAELARQWFNEEDGRPAPGYDAQLAHALDEIDIAKPMPEMWKQFNALSHVPVMVIRGELSDLLSAKTVAKMGKQHPRLVPVTIPGQGHAPLLRDRFSQRVIADFLRDAGEVTLPVPRAPFDA